jgi:hypothetical protein
MKVNNRDGILHQDGGYMTRLDHGFQKNSFLFPAVSNPLHISKSKPASRSPKSTQPQTATTISHNTHKQEVLIKLMLKLSSIKAGSNRSPFPYNHMPLWMGWTERVSLVSMENNYIQWIWLSLTVTNMTKHTKNGNWVKIKILKFSCF